MTLGPCFEGIDPGAKGAVSFLWPHECWLQVYDLPVTKVVGTERTFTYVDAEALVDLIELHKPNKAFLERVHSLPHDGPVGAFSFGDNFGSIKGAHARRVDIKTVEPSVWKSNLKVTSNKQEAKARAKELFPRCVHFFTRPDKAEAAMISLYGVLSLGIVPRKPFTPFPGGVS